MLAQFSSLFSGFVALSGERASMAWQRDPWLSQYLLGQWSGGEAGCTTEHTDSPPLDVLSRQSQDLSADVSVKSVDSTPVYWLLLAVSTQRTPLCSGVILLVPVARPLQLHACHAWPHLL